MQPPLCFRPHGREPPQRHCAECSFSLRPNLGMRSGNHAVMSDRSIRRRHIKKDMFVSGRLADLPGKIYSQSSDIPFAADRISKQRAESGTRCSFFIFIRSRLHVLASRSISGHLARITSPARAAVKMRNSKPSLIEMAVFASRSSRRRCRQVRIGQSRHMLLLVIVFRQSHRNSFDGIAAQCPFTLHQSNTVLRRCFTRRAVSGFSFQMGERAASTCED